MFGIKCFVSSHSGFQGDIKVNWEDFEVREIEKDRLSTNENIQGKRASSSESSSLPPKCIKLSSESDDAELVEPLKNPFAERKLEKPSMSNLEDLVGHDTILQVQQLAESVTDSPSIETCIKLGQFGKEQRWRLHQYFRYLFPCLKTVTVRDDTAQKEMTIEIDTVYEEFCTVVNKEEVDQFFKFVHCRCITNDNEFVFSDIKSKEDRTKVHRLISRHFGSIMKSKTFNTSNKNSDNVSIEGMTSEIHVKFKEKKVSSSNSTKEDNANDVPCIFHSFALCKRNIETLDAICRLSHVLGIQPSYFSYAGVKDKRAVTYQRVAVRDISVDRLKKCNEHPSLESIELFDFREETRPLRLGDLSGNRFKIVVRSIHIDTELEAHRDFNGYVEKLISDAIKNVQKHGFVNYYGLQRFGRVESSANTATIGLAILKGNIKEAVDLVLTPAGNNPDEDSAKEYFQRTKDVSGTLDKMPPWKTREILILKALQRHGYDIYGCTKAIYNLPFNVRLMYVHSYCSLLWNKMASVRFKLFGLKVVEGDLVLPGVDSGTDLEANRSKVVTVSAGDIVQNRYNISQVVLPLPGKKVQYPKNGFEATYREALSNDGVKDVNFTVKKLGMSVPGAYRHLIRYPSDVKWSWIQKSDLTGKFQMCCYRRLLLVKVISQYDCCHDD